MSGVWCWDRIILKSVSLEASPYTLGFCLLYVNKMSSPKKKRNSGGVPQASLQIDCLVEDGQAPTHPVTSFSALGFQLGTRARRKNRSATSTAEAPSALRQWVSQGSPKTLF